MTHAAHEANAAHTEVGLCGRGRGSTIGDGAGGDGGGLAEDRGCPPRSLGHGGAELGQRAGIFQKHGLTLDLTYPRAEETIETAVISGRVDVGVGVGIIDVLRAYATKKAPIRIIGANMTGSANYWYVAATSPIKTIKDISGKTIAYSKADAFSQYDVFDLIQRYGVKPRPVLIAGATATFDQVMASKIDVGWATPPFGVDAVEQGRIRVLAKANDIPKIGTRRTA